MKMNQTKKDLDLISIVKLYPCLYESKSKKKDKIEAWTKISQFMISKKHTDMDGKFEKNCVMKQISKYIRYYILLKTYANLSFSFCLQQQHVWSDGRDLRDSYIRSHKKLQFGDKNVSKFYKELSFLEEHVSHFANVMLVIFSLLNNKKHLFWIYPNST